MRTVHNLITRIAGVAVLLGVMFFCAAYSAEAATLRLSPNTGVYTAGNTFTARVLINTNGQSVNAAEGRLSFNPSELSVVNVSRASSIFNLWTAEPSFSNSAGTIDFGGGSPTGYSGSAGTVMSITFRTKAAGTPKVTFSSGSVLAADGLGTNVLTNMSGGTYTVSAQADTPPAETIYVPPANTPAAPVITSTTHPDDAAWYSNTTAELTWGVPSGITAVRTLLDGNPGTVPTIVYDEPITGRTIEDLEQGVSYFHLQFRNADGWGRVSHYRLAVDTEKPTAFEISQPEDQDPANPEQRLLFAVEDVSPVTRYLIQLDGGEAVEFTDKEETGVYTITNLSPGRHTVVVEAFDSAGNSIVSSYAFDVSSFDKPIFTDYPEQLNVGVVPVLRGSTRPLAEVTVRIASGSSEPVEYVVTANDSGGFTFIPDQGFAAGVYDITAVAHDEYGAQSDPSETIRIVVQESGYILIGGILVSFLSILVPLIALLVLLIFGTWYIWHRLSLWRSRVRKETLEAEQRLAKEFATITQHLDEQVAALRKSRKGKLTKAEDAMISQIAEDLKVAQDRISKEIEDIDRLTK